MSNSAASLQGKAALVTGAATGIGKAIAAALAAAAGGGEPQPHPRTRGQDRRRHRDGRGDRDRGRRRHHQPGRIPGDGRAAAAEYGRWDILVNNAAVAITKPFPEITEAEFDTSFAVNIKGVFHGLQLAREHLADNGRIITISSSTTGLMLPGYAVHDATKGAVEQIDPHPVQGVRPAGHHRERRQPGRHRDRDLPGRQERAVPGQPGGDERVRQARPPG